MKKLVLLVFKTFVFFANFQPCPSQEKFEDIEITDFFLYQKNGDLSGSLDSIGSDTLNNMMSLWTEDFIKKYPNVKINIEGKGGTTAPTALTNKLAQFGPMSREMTQLEIDTFEKKNGFKPSKLIVAYDAIIILVNRNNPIKTLSLEEIDAIFSKNRLREFPNDIVKWGDAGVKGELNKLDINLYGRSSASGTSKFLRENVLKNGDFKDKIKTESGSSALIHAIKEDKMGVGFNPFSGLGYVTPEVRILPLSIKKEGETFEVTPENINSLKYPLSRKLYIYYVKTPDQPLSKLEKEFLKFVVSKEGQSIVIKDGFLPITKLESEQAIKDLEK